MFDLQAYLDERRLTINAELERRLPPETQRPAVLHRAMRYSVLGDAKRLRPILCLAACEAVGGQLQPALLPALAIELLHTYTLIHDDLPCMDDDDQRRGRPTLHVAFDEATALLAGDALLTMAFEWLAEATPPPPYTIGHLVRELAEAAGSRGVIAGQVEDLAAEQATPDAARLDFIHRAKTAALIRAAARLGGMCGGATSPHLASLTNYGENFGLAFQIADDLLNVTSSTEVLGKPVGTDVARGKLTAIAVYGVEGARTRALDLAAAARESLRGLPGPTEPLAALVQYAVSRNA